MADHDPSERYAALRALDLGALIGLPVAAAQAEIEAVGGRLRAIAPGQPVTADYRPDRVTLVVVGDLVTELIGIG